MEIKWDEPLEMLRSNGDWSDAKVVRCPGIDMPPNSGAYAVKIANTLIFFKENGESFGTMNDNCIWYVEPGFYQIRNKEKDIILRIHDLRFAYSCKYMKDPDVVYVGIHEVGEILLYLRKNRIIKETSVDPSSIDGTTIEGMNVLRIFKQSWLQVGKK